MSKEKKAELEKKAMEMLQDIIAEEGAYKAMRTANPGNGDLRRKVDSTFITANQVFVRNAIKLVKDYEAIPEDAPAEVPAAEAAAPVEEVKS